MFNIFKKKKVVEEQPDPKVGSYRIKSQGVEHSVERYMGTGDWLSIPRPVFDTIDAAKQWIKEREERLNAPVTYTYVNLDEL